MSKKKSSRAQAKRPAVSPRKHLSAHLQRRGVGHARRMRMVTTPAKAHSAGTRITRFAIWNGDPESLAERGFSGLTRTGSVTLFRWPADMIAAGYTSTAHPHHFVRMESGDFPKRLLRAYDKLTNRQASKTVVSLIEIRAFHAHLAWAHIVNGTNDAIIPLLPNLLGIKPGKKYRRADVEQAISITEKRRSPHEDRN